MRTRKYIFPLLITAVIVVFLFILLNGIQTGQEQIPTPTGEVSTGIPSNNQTATPQPPHEAETGPLFVNPDNPRYFTDGIKIDGKYRAIYVTGSHTWCDFIDCGVSNPPSVFDYTGFLDFLTEHNFNFFRLWRAENARGGENGDGFWFSPMPYERFASECCAFDGGNKFDLDRFNQEYFNRMRSRIQEAGKRGIYVSIMLFDGWSVESKFDGHNPWKGHPYNVQNNVNGVDGDVNNDGQGGEIQTLDVPQTLALEEAYVRKVIDTVNDLDNVLYEIDNEGSGISKDWQYHMISLIKSYELTKPKQHPVGMTVEYPNGNNADVLDSPADWVSLNGDGNNPPIADSTKVILSDTDHLCGICGDLQWTWKSFTRGENPIFMDPYADTQIGRGAPEGYDRNNANDTSLRLNLGYTRSYADRMNLVAMSPQPALCSTGYCLANPVADGAEYLVFLPSGATVTRILSWLDIDKNLNLNLPTDSKVEVNLSGSPVELLVEWFNPVDGTIIVRDMVYGGGSQSFIAPFRGDAVLYIYDAKLGNVH